MEIVQVDSYLEKPSLPLKASYLDALRDGHVCGNEPVRTAPEVAAIEADFSNYIERLNRQGELMHWPNGLSGPEVPYERLWLTDGENFMGETVIRYAVNSYYEQHRGHISYGVPPKFRGMGLATRILQMDLDRLKEAGVTEAILTCNVTNHASIRVIQKAGGHLTGEGTFPWKPAPVTARFVIPLPQPVPEPKRPLFGRGLAGMGAALV